MTEKRDDCRDRQAGERKGDGTGGMLLMPAESLPGDAFADCCRRHRAARAQDSAHQERLPAAGGRPDCRSSPVPRSTETLFPRLERSAGPAAVHHVGRIAGFHNPGADCAVLLLGVELQEAVRVGPDPLRHGRFQDQSLPVSNVAAPWCATADNGKPPGARRQARMPSVYASRLDSLLLSFISSCPWPSASWSREAVRSVRF